MMTMTQIHDLLSRGYYSDEEILAPFITSFKQIPEDERYDVLQDLDDRVWPELDSGEQEVWLIVFSGLMCLT